MQLKVLGQLALTGAVFTRPKPLLLLAYLALEGPTTRERLVEVFFGGERSGAARLRTTLNRLREVSPDLIVVQGTRVSTAVPCDAVRFAATLRDGDLQAAADLYGGSFVTGVALSGWTPDLEDWVERTRQDLAGQQRRALTDLARLRARGADHAGAAELARRARSLPDAPEPGDEAQVLDRLLGAGTQRARGVPGDDRAGRHAELPFVGRDGERAALRRTLAQPDAQLVVIVGPGGIGKSRLAREVAREIDREVRIIPVEAQPDPVHLPLAVAHALGRPQPAGDDVTGALQVLLGHQPTLLLIDSAEQLPARLTWLPPLLRACPALKVLLTSRERVPLDAAWTLFLGGLTLPPERATPDRIRQSDAAQLFVSLLQRQRLDVRVGPGDWPVVARICERLGGSPLALHLAAAWGRVWSLPRIEQTLSRSLDVLEDAGRGERHASMRRVVGDSWARLSPADQLSLAKLSVFEGSADPDAARALTGLDWTGVTRLIDASMLACTSEGRYHMHPLIREFAAEHLSAADLALAEGQRRELTLGAARQIGSALRALQDESAWVSRAFQELPNLRRSVAEWLNLGDLESAALALNDLRPFYARGPALREFHGWYRLVLRRADALPPDLRAKTLLCAGQIAMDLGLATQADEDLAAALQVSAALGHTSPLLHLLAGLNHAAQDRADAAVTQFEAAHQGFLDAGAWNGVASSLNGLGSARRRLGDHSGALRAFEAALQAKRRAGGDEESALLNLASAHHDLGRPDRAAPLYVQALQGLSDRQFLNHIPAALAALARLVLDLGQPVLAAQLLSAASAHDSHVESAPLPAEEEWRADLLRRTLNLLDAGEPEVAEQAWQTGRAWSPQEALAEVQRALRGMPGLRGAPV
ncbi:AAA family ATPase [Deinococcus sp. JMULE3]|uniref:ATP-binding protein n=1 Tax=Deinococcus sp. JMULE3 TaxID=2518341 RepID=UPI001575C9C6|nr:AAA family ATPase [Deinococcus sp. JMULE3]